MFRHHFFIVTELMDINMYHYITQHKQTGMPRELLREVAQQILIGLKQLIQIKIIHCDLKPENILFTNKSH